MVEMNWLSREEAAALGWTLLHFLWQGAALAAAYSILDRLTLRTNSSLRYLIALVALAIMPLVVIGTFANEVRLSSPTEATPQPMRAISHLNFDAPHTHLSSGLQVNVPPPIISRRAWLADHLEPALPWIDAVWMTGVSLLAMRAMGGWYRLQTVRKRAHRLVPAEVEHRFRLICQKMRLGRQVSLRISEEVISPLAMGVWHTAVILPVSAVLHLPPSELEAVLAHELGHIRRLDYLCNLFQTAVESVLFFHPAVWWLSRTVRERREVCCDEIAVSVCADPVVYAQALLRMEVEKTARLQLAITLKGRNGSLLRRVKLVLGDRGNVESGATGGIRVAAAAILAVGLLFGPKVRKVVAAPLISVSQTRFNHAMPAVSLVAKPQSEATPVKATAGPENRVEANVTVAPMPAAVLDVRVKVNPNPSPQVVVADKALSINFVSGESTSQSSGTAGSQSPGRSSSTKGSTYIEEMKAAGYPLDLNNDLDTLVALKSLGVTPDYARSMAATGLGKPSLHDLIALKSLGVTPEYLASLKQTGLGPKDLHEAVALKSLGVTPEYAADMKQAGFSNLDTHELVALKAQGMTPEHARWLKQQFPQATPEEMQRAAVFHIDDQFMARAKSHGFDSTDLDKLLRLKMSGLLDE